MENIVKQEQLYEGKAKKVYATNDPDLVIVDYKDDATAFNGEKKGTISGKGVINNRMTNYMFKMLEKEGVPTHLVEEISERETIVKKVSIVPLEVIIRNVAAGSFSKRMGVEEGTKLLTPILEFSYKNDDLGDPFINDLIGNLKSGIGLLDFCEKGFGRVESFNEGLDIVLWCVVAGLGVLDNLLGRFGGLLGEFRLKVGDSLVAVFDCLLLFVADAVFVGERGLDSVELRGRDGSRAVLDGDRLVGENSRQEGVGLNHCGGDGIGGRFEKGGNGREKFAEQTLAASFGKGDVRYRHTGVSHSRSERVGKFGSGFIGKVGDFINEAPVEGFLCREPCNSLFQGN